MRNTPNVLQKIADYKVTEVAKLRSETSASELLERAKAQTSPRGFRQAIIDVSRSHPAIIAEVKKASPSKGVIREDFNPVEIAKAYESGGAACLSVLTDGPGFQGSNEIFAAVRDITSLPIIRKDFMIDPIQIIESRAMGADAVLIIMAMIDDKLAASLFATAQELDMDVLVETHDLDELNRALKLGPTLIGINNRDLRTFETSLDTFTTLAPKVPTGPTLIAESGIFTFDDIDRLTREGAQGFLIGESLMRHENVELALRNLHRG